MELVDGSLLPSTEVFLAEFSGDQKLLSSTLRELLGMLWWVRATRDRTKYRLVFICDNLQSCRAVLRGSRVPAIQRIAEEIFLWCLDNRKVCWPIWVPRTHVLIREADRRSRLSIPYDDRSPHAVVTAANRMAVNLWGAGLSFDQAASHKTAIRVRGVALPFNAFCFQPGASGIDMFRCMQSWRCNINYVFPPEPMTGRLLTFLPTTRAKTVVALKLPIGNAWWSYTLQPHSTGLLAPHRVAGFKIFAFDFSTQP